MFSFIFVTFASIFKADLEATLSEEGVAHVELQPKETVNESTVYIMSCHIYNSLLLHCFLTASVLVDEVLE